MDRFLELNFTGPSKREQSSVQCLENLKSDGLVPHKLTQGAAHLVTALEDSSSPLELARALVIQQSLFSSSSESLRKKIFELYDQVAPFDGLYLELARAHLVYNQLPQCLENLELAQKQQGLKWTLTGLLGKRTQHQSREASQLVVLARSLATPSSKSLEPCIPNRPHNSEVLLERPLFTQAAEAEFEGLDPNNQPALAGSDAALLLLWAEYMLRSNPAEDAAVNERVLAIADRIIFSPTDSNDWLLYSRALWLRSCVESHHSSRSIYTMERGILQMTDIVNGLHETEAANRLAHVHQMIPLPKWTIDTELAKRLVQIGGMAASASIYDRLDLPVDAAVCYAASGENAKALEKLEEYMAHTPNDARAWALKGDITQDIGAWEKAWSLGHNIMAKVSLGKYYQAKGDFETARKHLKEAAVADADNLDTQFTLGCVLLQLQDFPGAERAFTQCIRIQPDDAKSWSNLGAVHFKLGKAEQALHAFERAIRVDQNEEPNVRVWANYITLASELRKWNIVVDSYKYMVDTEFSGQGYINPSILTEMTAAFTMAEYKGTALEKSFAVLMCEKLPVRVAGEPNLWRLAAKVQVWQGRPWDALKSYENGWQMVLETPEDSTAQFKKIAQWTALLADAYMSLGDLEGRIEGSKVCPEGALKARQAVQRALARGDAHKQSLEYQRLQSLI